MRIRPAVGDAALRKVSKDSLSVAERKFTFDAVFDSDSSQVWHLYSNSSWFQSATHFITTVCSCRFNLEPLIIWTQIQKLIFA